MTEDANTQQLELGEAVKHDGDCVESELDYQDNENKERCDSLIDPTDDVVSIV